jgi:hypothetical protein
MVELMIAVGFSVMLLTGVYGFYNASSQIYINGIAGQALQDGVNVMLIKILEGESESNIVYRLSTGTSYMIPNGVGTALYTCGGAAQAAPCNATWTSGEIYYCQVNPCTYNDPTARWYYLNSTGTSLIYHHFLTAGGTVDEKIYTAPKGSSMTLRFVSATAVPANVVRVDAALVTNLLAGQTNARLATSGAATTYILLRNHP